MCVLCTKRYALSSHIPHRISRVSPPHTPHTPHSDTSAGRTRAPTRSSAFDAGIETVRRDSLPAEAKLLEKCLAAVHDERPVGGEAYALRQFDKTLSSALPCRTSVRRAGPPRHLQAGVDGAARRGWRSTGGGSTRAMRPTCTSVSHTSSSARRAAAGEADRARGGQGPALRRRRRERRATCDGPPTPPPPSLTPSTSSSTTTSSTTTSSTATHSLPRCSRSTRRTVQKALPAGARAHLRLIGVDVRQWHSKDLRRERRPALDRRTRKAEAARRRRRRRCRALSIGGVRALRRAVRARQVVCNACAAAGAAAHNALRLRQRTPRSGGCASSATARSAPPPPAASSTSAPRRRLRAAEDGAARGRRRGACAG